MGSMNLRVNANGTWSKNLEGSWFTQRCLRSWRYGLRIGFRRYCYFGCPLCVLNDRKVGEGSSLKQVTTLGVLCEPGLQVEMLLYDSDIVVTSRQVKSLGKVN